MALYAGPSPLFHCACIPRLHKWRCSASSLQGTPTTKKKKIRKLKRVMRVVEKSKRRGQAASAESFAAMQLLHDPQSFAERLLVRCQARGVSFEMRLALMQVVSRAIGVHELILENFYPFVQRYLKPSQREVVAILAAAVQACHRLVPSDMLRPVLSQVVDQFVHDKARPEVWPWYVLHGDSPHVPLPRRSR